MVAGSSRLRARIRFDTIRISGEIDVMISPPVGLSHELTGISCSDQQRNSGCSSRPILWIKNTSKKPEAAFV